jgi:hypothetical protein
MTLRLGRWDDGEGLTPHRQSRRWGQDEKLKRTRCIPLIPTLFKRILILRCRADRAVTPKAVATIRPAQRTFRREIMRNPLLGIGLVALALGLCSPPVVAGPPDQVASQAGGLPALRAIVEAQAAVIANLQSTVAEMQTTINQLQGNTGCMTQSGNDVYFTGCNVHIRNGLGATGPNVNGLGNLIVGYNEDATLIPGNSGGEPSVRTGSHNVIIGAGNSWTDRGGLVVGVLNTIGARYETVTGLRNSATGAYANVIGGQQNTAIGDFSSVSGGQQNTASGFTSSVSGGLNNTASGFASSVSGGQENLASGPSASASGGIANVASGEFSSASAGVLNTASGRTSAVSGGFQNTAAGESSSVTGGQQNIASAQSSSVSGGANRSAPLPLNWAAGGLLEPN